MREAKKADVLNWLINNGVVDSINEVILSDADVAVRAQMQTALVYLQSDIATLNPDNPKLLMLIGGLQALGKVTDEMVAAFWALFEEPEVVTPSSTPSGAVSVLDIYESETGWYAVARWESGHTREFR